jgi:hypothetical protein
MARDDSPKVRQKNQLARKLAKRPSYDRILIISEGSKTEPNYFREIRAAYKLHTASVEVRRCEIGTAPIQVAQYAQDLFMHGDSHKHIPKRAFERVYAVFDRDNHQSFQEALNLAASLHKKLINDSKQPVVFQAAPSVPCFELWLLLHFEDIQSPLGRNEAFHRLRQHISNFDKSASNIFAITKAHLDIAIERAERLAAGDSAPPDVQPFTEVGALVKLLTSLRG